MDDLFLIAGLGNPGLRYDNTRHNVGFEVIDLLSQKYNIKVSKVKFKGITGEGSIQGQRVILLKPRTFMNLSGESVREAVSWYKVPLSRLLLIYDDIDIGPGKIRIRPSGTSGSHNGMKSVIYQLQDDQFPRIRIGIGVSPPLMELADYVLGKFTPEERELVNTSILSAAEAAEAFLRDGINSAMNKYNRS